MISLLFSAITAFTQDPDFHIYLCFGQSNMAGAGEIEQQDKTVDSRFQVMYPMVDCSIQGRTFGNWYDAVPPLWGCPKGGLGPADYFGRTMVEELPSEIKVGVIVIGIPGCDIRLFDKTDFEGLEAYTYNYIPSQYNRSAYAWLLDLAKKAKKDGVIKGFLMHQGETMPDFDNWTYHVERIYDSLVADLDLPSTTPLLAGEVVYDGNGNKGSHNAVIDTLPRVIPNAYVISAEGLTGKDQWHFTAASERIFGARYADTMLAVERTATQRSVRGATVNLRSPFTYTKNGVRIGLPGTFNYRIVNCGGALVDAGTGKGVVNAGGNLSPGIYMVSVDNARNRFTGTLFKR